MIHSARQDILSYCWLSRFAGDKIDMKREYKDTWLARKTLYVAASCGGRTPVCPVWS